MGLGSLQRVGTLTKTLEVCMDEGYFPRLSWTQKC